MLPRPALLDALQERVLILDGATGTALQNLNLTDEDFGGLDGCNEFLCITRPDAVERMHRSYLDVGVDGILTNSFGGSAITLAEYGIADRTREINREAAAIARRTADSYATPEQPRFVVGSMGPGTKMPSLGQVSFDEVHAAYYEQALGLIDGDVDALLVETVYDLLQAKAAIIATRDALAERGRELPILCTVTIETTGQMLMGSEIGAALTTLEPLGLASLGVNCATGPEMMHEHLRYLAQHSTLPIMVQPNAGLPRVEKGQAVYDLSAAQLAAAHETFVTDYSARIIGGCCGTTPEHMRAVVDAVAGRAAPERTADFELGASSLFTPVPYEQEASFLIVGERANANGSRKFKRLLAEENWDEMANLVRDQAKDGAHVVDVCVDYVGRDGVADMEKLVAMASGRTTLPIMLDSTEAPVLEAGLKLIGAKPLVNSINLEDGGDRLHSVLGNVIRFGAAVVALVIDEEGQARTADRKLEIAHRIHDLAVNEHGLRAGDLFFDALTLPLGSGQEELRNDGKETLEAIRRIKAEIPEVRTILGVSNISFGLNPASRQVLNSVFVEEAVEAGLDAAIVNARQLLPAHQIEPEQREASRRLIYNDWVDGVDPLPAFMALFEDATLKREAVDLTEKPVEERLHYRILDGLRPGLTEDLDEALASRGALLVINEVLLPAMKVVGELFGAGKMQLPFVLQSAETMKAAVAYLEPHMDRLDSAGKGTIVLATVRGDVHDIGKNLVDIILSNNGFSTVNIGIKQPIAAVIEAAEEHGADAVGLSGLLVKSTVVMKEDLIELNRRGLAGKWKILLGGAALTRSYVEQDLRDAFEGDVYYGKDAFEGLSIMNAIAEGRAPEGQERTAAREPKVSPADSPVATEVRAARSKVRTDVTIAEPPFWGRRVVKGVPLADVASYLNETALFRGQWGLRKNDLSDEDFEQLLENEARPTLRRLISEATAGQLLEPSVVYGYFPVQADDDDLIVYEDDQRTERLRFTFPRQNGKQNLCLADYYRPLASGEMDMAAFHVVTMGARISEHTQSLFAGDNYQDYLYWHGFGVEMAEALAEYWHHRIREELGLAADDGPAKKDLFAGRYRGARFSFGYPACPNLDDQALLFQLLDPDEIGVTLTEEFQLTPEQSTSAIVTAHPEAGYFNV